MTTYQYLAVATAVFPLLLTTGILLIPVVRNYADHQQAEQAVQKSGRWLWGHLLSGIAFAYGVVAGGSLALYLFQMDSFGWALLGLPLLTAGAGLQAAGLGADGIGPLAVREGGQPARLFFDNGRFVTRTFIFSSILFSLGQIILVSGVNQTNLLPTAWATLIFTASLVFSLSSAIPSGYGLYVVAIAALLIYLPITYALWTF